MESYYPWKSVAGSIQTDDVQEAFFDVPPWSVEVDAGYPDWMSIHDKPMVEPVGDRRIKQDSL
jgi:hypothetical protein